MQSRFTVLVVAAALISSAAWWLGSRDQARYEVDEAGLLFPGLKDRLAQVDSVRLHPAGETPFTLQLSGGAWGLSERDGYPIDTTILIRELRKLAKAKKVEAKTARPDYYPQLGVQAIADAEAPTLELAIGSGGKSALELLIGKPGKGGHYVRGKADEQSWLTDTRFNLPRRAADWLQRPIIEVARDRIAEISVTPAQGKPYRLHRPDSAAPNFTLDPLPEGREANVANLNRLAAAVSSLRLTDVARTPAEPGDDWNQTRFRTFDGLVVTAWSRKPEAGDGELRIEARYEAPPVAEGETADEAQAAELQAEVETVNARTAGWTYTVSGYNATALNFAHELLLKPLPEEGAEGG